MQLDFSSSMYSDPAMRPHLEKLYEQKYAAIRERIDNMDQSSEPQTVQMKNADGEIVEGKMFTAEQYRKIIPSFDKWLEMQQKISSFDFFEQTESFVEHARNTVKHLEEHFPDTSSGVRAVFSSGDQILGYINENSGVVVHQGGEMLQKISEQADRLGLSGEEKIAYIQERGEAELSRRHENISVESYGKGSTPTKREFAEKWYPDHQVDDSYDSALAEAREHLKRVEEWHMKQEQNMNEMRAFLLQSMEEAQAASA